MNDLLEAVQWNDDGLVAAIAQDHQTKQVLMMAWMNAEALSLTIQENRSVYWSRSRQRLWRKGEESGNVQMLKAIRLDCDGDAILLSVEQIGGIACHTGREHCFYRRWENEHWLTDLEVLKNPKEMYHE